MGGELYFIDIFLGFHNLITIHLKQALGIIHKLNEPTLTEKARQNKTKNNSKTVFQGQQM